MTFVTVCRGGKHGSKPFSALVFKVKDAAYPSKQSCRCCLELVLIQHLIGFGFVSKVLQKY